MLREPGRSTDNQKWSEVEMCSGGREAEDGPLTSVRDGAGRKVTEGFQEEANKPSLERRIDTPPGQTVQAGGEYRQRQNSETGWWRSRREC